MGQALSINSTALNRQILAIEDELGVPIFERLSRAVRLNPAGEVLVHMIRGQISDFERLKSQIADLTGGRRGHVAIASARMSLPGFLPGQIARYRADHPAVTFPVRRRSDRNLYSTVSPTGLKPSADTREAGGSSWMTGTRSATRLSFSNGAVHGRQFAAGAPCQIRGEGP